MNSHFIVPELGPDVQFSYASHKAVTEYKEAKAVSVLDMLFRILFIYLSFYLYVGWFLIMQVGVDTVPVFVGPVSYLLLSKPAKGVEKTFDLLSLLDKILPIYKYASFS